MPSSYCALFWEPYKRKNGMLRSARESRSKAGSVTAGNCVQEGTSAIFQWLMSVHRLHQ